MLNKNIISKMSSFHFFFTWMLSIDWENEKDIIFTEKFVKRSFLYYDEIFENDYKIINVTGEYFGNICSFLSYYAFFISLKKEDTVIEVIDTSKYFINEIKLHAKNFSEFLKNEIEIFNQKRFNKLTFKTNSVINGQPAATYNTKNLEKCDMLIFSPFNQVINKDKFFFDICHLYNKPEIKKIILLNQQTEDLEVTLNIKNIKVS